VRRRLGAGVAVVAVVGLVAALAGCGTETAADPGDAGAPGAPAAPPTSVPAADGPVTTAYPVTVLDDGDGAELCVGGQDDSLPPQCGGPRLLGWDWAQHRGGFETSRGVRWGEFVVTGTFDGTDVTPTEAVPAAEWKEPAASPPGRDPFRTPCPEPDGGWVPLDPATTTTATQDAAFRAAEALPTYAGGWVDQSINPAYADLDRAAAAGELNDPRLLVLNIQVTDDVAGAEAALREVWGGALCVSQAQSTEAERQRVADELATALPGFLGSTSGQDRVEATVLFDDGSLQAWADEEYGEGVVLVGSSLVPADG
jgi:hypothetical protein